MTDQATEQVQDQEVLDPQPTDVTGDVTPGQTEQEAGAAPAEQEPEKTGLEKRFSELTGQIRDLQQDNAYLRGRTETLEAQRQEPTPAPAQQEPVITPDMYETDADYQRALTEHITKSVKQTVNQSFQAQAENQKVVARQNQLVEAVKELPDILELAGNPANVMTKEMLDAADGANFPKILHHLCKNPGERARIMSLSPLQQAKEIGKIETKVTMQQPKKPNQTKAPDPAPTIGPGVGQPTNTVDPNKKTKADNFASWEQKRRERLGVK